LASALDYLNGRIAHFFDGPFDGHFESTEIFPARRRKSGAGRVSSEHGARPVFSNKHWNVMVVHSGSVGEITDKRWDGSRLDRDDA